MILSGLDWSGTPGEAHGPWLVIAIAHVDEEDLTTLDTELSQVRAQLRVDEDFVFRHSNVAAIAKNAFFSAVPRLPVLAHVHMLNKAAWSAHYVSGSSGTDCICDGIVMLLSGCPHAVIAGQRLYLDIPREEATVVERYRTTLRQAMRRARQPVFRDVRPRPADARNGAMIQIADMIAGEVREHGGMAGPYLPSLRAQVRVI